jgi:glycosyltransferase involved in cell wall biosynthesis
VDDGSPDGAGDCLQRELDQPGTIVVCLDRNRGKGTAVRTGLERATDVIVLIQDADLEYDPRDYTVLVRHIVEGRAKVVNGSRFLGPRTAMMFWHMLANKSLTLLANVLYNTILSDMETCSTPFPSI